MAVSFGQVRSPGTIDSLIRKDQMPEIFILISPSFTLLGDDLHTEIRYAPAQA